MRTLTYSTWGVLFLLGVLSSSPAMTEVDDGFDDFEERIDAVNEGSLEFLPLRPDKPVHHHQNHITISADSMVTGWTHLQQCHHNLDPVPKAQVVYNDAYTRRLNIVSYSGIDSARVEGATIQLSGIEPSASLCIEAETRAFWPDERGGFVLRNGPYMRRFLDGYYPMHVSLTIQYPDKLLRFDSSEPAEQPGFKIRTEAGRLDIDTWFEGRLITVLRFDHRL